MHKNVWIYSNETDLAFNKLLNILEERGNSEVITEEQNLWRKCFADNIVDTKEQEEMILETHKYEHANTPKDDSTKSVDTRHSLYIIDDDLTEIKENNLLTVIEEDELLVEHQENYSNIHENLIEIIDYTIDVLNNNNSFPKVKFIDLYNAINEYNLEVVFSQLQQKLNLQGICSLCQIVSEYDIKDKEMFVKQLCKQIVLPRLKSSKAPHSFITCVNKLIHLYPEIIIKFLFVPIITGPESFKNISDGKTLIKDMEDKQKQQLLSEYLIEYSQNLLSFQIPLLEILVLVEPILKYFRLLLNLMHRSKHNFTNDISFGRLLMSIAQFIGKSGESLYNDTYRMMMEEIIRSNETLFKKRALKMLGLE